MILVTGSGGFIGPYLVRALSASLIPVLGHDIKKRSKDSREAPPKPLDTLLALYGKYLQAIFHLGAISDTTCTDAKALEETNVRLTVRLGQFAESRGIPFIYASSASVYGNGHGPLNAYALSKISADEIMEARVGGDWYGLRFFNVYGADEEAKGEQRSMVSKAIDAYRDGEAPRFYDLTARRDFVHVDDVVNTMLLFWKQKPRSGIYDVGTGVSRSIEEMCDIVQKQMGISHAPIEIGVPPEMAGKLQTNTCAQPGNAAYLTLEEGVARTLSVQRVVSG